MRGMLVPRLDVSSIVGGQDDGGLVRTPRIHENVLMS
jgi:hypothetical protein